MVSIAVTIHIHNKMGANTIITDDMQYFAVIRNRGRVGQMAEDGCRRAEVGGQKTEDRCRRAEVGGQKTEDRCRRAEDRLRRTDGRILDFGLRNLD